LADRVLPTGAKLPSTRSLAQGLRVNRQTVVAAYQDLRRRGMLRAGVGQGTFVAEQGIGATESLAAARPVVAHLDWGRALRSRARRAQSRLWELPATVEGEAINFSRAIPDPDLYPVPALTQILARIGRSGPKHVFDYAPAAGYEPLREVLQK